MPLPKTTVSFVQLVYSPKGGIEGMIGDVNGEIAQYVVAKDDEEAAGLLVGLQAGQMIDLRAVRKQDSRKGTGSHPVYELEKILSVDGKRCKVPSPAKPSYAGKILRLNYARHVAPNGFVLESGDFIHVKPGGFVQLGLKVGDQVIASGDAHLLSTGTGWAVEAHTVNGKTVS